MGYVTGEVIRELRKNKKMTQIELAERLVVSDKTVSKWETGRGLPDISILEELAGCLGISVAELLTGDVATNQNHSANMRKTSFYVCPVCGNVIASAGEGHFSCCGITLPPLEAEDDSVDHKINVETIDGELFVSLQHAMTKKHYISFFAFATSDRIQLVKLYPEQNAECRFMMRGHGTLYAYCNRHGMIKKMI